MDEPPPLDMFEDDDDGGFGDFGAAPPIDSVHIPDLGLISPKSNLLQSNGFSAPPSTTPPFSLQVGNGNAPIAQQINQTSEFKPSTLTKDTLGHALEEEQPSPRFTPPPLEGDFLLRGEGDL